MSRSLERVAPRSPRRGSSFACLGAAIIATVATVTIAGAARVAEAGQVAPYRSAPALPSSNGVAAISYDANGHSLTQFLEHPYRYPTSEQQPYNRSTAQILADKMAPAFWMDGVGGEPNPVPSEGESADENLHGEVPFLVSICTSIVVETKVARSNPM